MHPFAMAAQEQRIALAARKLAVNDQAVLGLPADNSHLRLGPVGSQLLGVNAIDLVQHLISRHIYMSKVVLYCQ